MSRKQPFGSQQNSHSTLGLHSNQSTSFSQTQSSLRQKNVAGLQQPTFMNSSVNGSSIPMQNSFLNQNSQNTGANNINGMNTISSHSGHRVIGDKHSKKENDYQKLNKQSTMLYLHHHPNQSQIASQSSSTSALTHSLIANNDKYGPSNSNSFCMTKGASYQGSDNHQQHSSRATSSSHMNSYQQQPLKEVMHLNDLENRPHNNLHNNLPHITHLNQNQNMSDYQSFNNTATGPLMQNHNIGNAKTKIGKMFMKDHHHQLPLGSRRNSQDKMHHNTSLVHNSSMMTGATSNNQSVMMGGGVYQPHENTNKNRPQTSYRLATKNTFSSQNTSLTNIHQSSSQNNLHSMNQSQNQGINQSSMGGNHNSHQHLQPKILQNGNVDQSKQSQHNKENVGILSNTGAYTQGAMNQISTNNLQKHLDSVPQIQYVLQDQSLCQDMPMHQLSEIERENLHVTTHYGEDIDEYQRELELFFDTKNSLIRHKITPVLRARMVDWMIEVLTNFKCDDQTFFLAVSLLDRFFKGKSEVREVSDLHIIGVTTMFIASKYEDIYPLKMKMVFEKIAHKKLSIDKIKGLEMDILKVINYRIAAPTSLDFLKVYLKQVLNIGKCGKSSKQEKKDSEATSSANTSTIVQPPATPQSQEQLLIEKMSLYLAKMAVHDYELSGRQPSLQAVGALYVSLKICEQLKKTSLITPEIVSKLVQVSKAKEDDIVEVSQRVLYLAQNFERAFPGLENLKKTHFVNITQLL